METEKPPLGRDVLRDVSRSFYLSLRFLPSGIRDPASLAYLLARLSDTIADAGTLVVEERWSLLEAYRKLAGDLPETDDVPAFGGILRLAMESAGLPDGEATLVTRAEEVFTATSRLPDTVLGAVRNVIAIIVEGQQWDLTRFEGDGCVVLEEDAELERYAYQVAGCVGGFWTDLAYAVIDKPSSATRGEMEHWGRNYGKGLQLVNILRDVPEDLRHGRCYLPGVDPANRDELLQAAARWRQQAREWLRDGFRYVDALRGMRLKIGSGLPALLGVQTLDLLEEATWNEWEQGVKVTRRDVKRAMARAAALSAPILPGKWLT